MNKLKILWKKVENTYIGTKKYFLLTPTHYSVYYDFVPFMKKYIKGLTLDLGAGRLGWRFLIERYTTRYISSDIKLESKDLSFISDGENIAVVDNSFDSLICFQVLEHVKNPKEILNEIARIMKKEACAIVSFPHLSYIHAEPEDYFRYTIYGFKSICPANLQLEVFKESGGLICFAATTIFIFFNSIFYKIPIFGKLIFYLFAVLSIVTFHLDKKFGLKTFYPLNYIVVLRKNKTSE